MAGHPTVTELDDLLTAIVKCEAKIARAAMGEEGMRLKIARSLVALAKEEVRAAYQKAKKARQ